jgi:hypothetical protein
LGVKKITEALQENAKLKLDKIQLSKEKMISDFFNLSLAPVSVAWNKMIGLIPK